MWDTVESSQSKCQLSITRFSSVVFSYLVVLMSFFTALWEQITGSDVQCDFMFYILNTDNINTEMTACR